MKFNDENKSMLFSERVFTDVLEGVSLNIFSSDPQFTKYHNYDKLYWYIVFDPLVIIFDMQEFQTLNLVST